MRKKPMLAYPVNDKQIDYKQPVFIQPKLDGVRCLIQYEIPFGSGHIPNSGKVVAYSRTGKEWKNIDHILKELKPFFIEHPSVILDGELYNHDLRNDFEQIISLVRRQKPDDIDALESRDSVQFHCYDIVDENNVFDVRADFIGDNLPESYCVKHVYTTRVYKHEEALDMHHNYNLVSGYEGSIVRTNDVYQCKRSHSLRKFKDFQDTEATITGYVEGKGKRKGTLGKFLMRDNEGNEFGCPPGKGYNYKDLAVILKNVNDYIGKIATFTYFERTKAGSYRHPLFKCIRDYE